jgi:hypothetical protein
MNLAAKLAISILLLASASAQDLELRSFHVYTGELASLKTLDIEGLDDLVEFTDFVEKRLAEMRMQPDADFYDVRTLIDADLGESGFAIWNEKTRVLTVRGPAEELEKLDEEFQPWTEDDRPYRIAIEAVCIRAHSPPDPKRLLGAQPTVQQLLVDGAFGKPELVHVAAVRAKSGQRAKVEANDLPQVRSVTMEVDPFAGSDQIVIDLNLAYEMTLQDGPRFRQTTTLTLSVDHPMVLQLGGRGTAEDPAYFLVMRAWAERVDGEVVDELE